MRRDYSATWLGARALISPVLSRVRVTRTRIDGSLFVSGGPALWINGRASSSLPEVPSVGVCGVMPDDAESAEAQHEHLDDVVDDATHASSSCELLAHLCSVGGCGSAHTLLALGASQR